MVPPGWGCFRTYRWFHRAAAASTGSPGSGIDSMVSGDLLDRLAATDRLHGDPGLELGTVSAALTDGRKPGSGATQLLKG